jgi:L-seryl-tRNA(Ser) seleniumtransferase
VQRMLRMGKEEIGVRADALAISLNASGWTARVVDGMSTVGGGSAPGAELPTRLVEISRDGMTADAIEQHLRSLDPPVIARIQDDRVVLDLRTVLPNEDAHLLTVHAPTA